MISSWSNHFCLAQNQAEYKWYIWNKRFEKRRRTGVNNFWKQEKKRLERGERGTRRWTKTQQRDILLKRHPKHKGKTIESHHTYSVSKYPHLANRGEIIYPATHKEHFSGWHGGSYKKCLPGKPIRPIKEF